MVSVYYDDSIVAASEILPNKPLFDIGYIVFNFKYTFNAFKLKHNKTSRFRFPTYSISVVTIFVFSENIPQHHENKPIRRLMKYTLRV